MLLILLRGWSPLLNNCKHPFYARGKVIQIDDLTRYAIASKLNVAQTSHSYGDLILLTKASQLKQENPSLYLVEMAWVKNAFNISTSETEEFLDKFLSMSPDSRLYIFFWQWMCET